MNYKLFDFLIAGKYSNADERDHRRSASAHKGSIYGGGAEATCHSLSRSASSIPTG